MSKTVQNTPLIGVCLEGSLKQQVFGIFWILFKHSRIRYPRRKTLENWRSHREFSKTSRCHSPRISVECWTESLKNPWQLKILIKTKLQFALLKCAVVKQVPQLLRHVLFNFEHMHGALPSSQTCQKQIQLNGVYLHIGFCLSESNWW